MAAANGRRGAGDGGPGRGAAAAAGVAMGPRGAAGLAVALALALGAAGAALGLRHRARARTPRGGGLAGAAAGGEACGGLRGVPAALGNNTHQVSRDGRTDRGTDSPERHRAGGAGSYRQHRGLSVPPSMAGAGGHTPLPRPSPSLMGWTDRQTDTDPPRVLAGPGAGR